MGQRCDEMRARGGRTEKPRAHRGKVFVVAAQRRDAEGAAVRELADAELRGGAGEAAAEAGTAVGRGLRRV